LHRDGRLATHHDCASPGMAICLVEVCISSLWAGFLSEVVGIVLCEAMVPCICLFLEVARSSCEVVTSVFLCSCLCIRLDIGHLLLDYESDGATYLLGEAVSGPCGQEHMSRQHRCWEERGRGHGRGRVLEEGHWGDH
jgi:hypothetical protein